MLNCAKNETCISIDAYNPHSEGMRGDFMENEEQEKGIGVTLKIREGES